MGSAAEQLRHPSELPPRVPRQDHELKEAVDLCNAVKQVGARLKLSRQERLRQLLGCMPTQQEAKLWVPILNEMRREPALRG